MSCRVNFERREPLRCGVLRHIVLIHSVDLCGRVHADTRLILPLWFRVCDRHSVPRVQLLHVHGRAADALPRGAIWVRCGPLLAIMRACGVGCVCVCVCLCT